MLRHDGPCRPLSPLAAGSRFSHPDLELRAPVGHAALLEVGGGQLRVEGVRRLLRLEVQRVRRQEALRRAGCCRATRLSTSGWRSIDQLTAWRKSAFSSHRGRRPGRTKRLTLSIPVTDCRVTSSRSSSSGRCSGGTRSIACADPSSRALSRVWRILDELPDQRLDPRWVAPVVDVGLHRLHVDGVLDEAEGAGAVGLAGELLGVAAEPGGGEDRGMPRQGDEHRGERLLGPQPRRQRVDHLDLDRDPVAVE